MTMTSIDPLPLTPRQVAPLLRAMAASVNAELTALPAAVLTWHPAAGEWCVQETLGHIIEAERRGFAGRIREILAANEPLLPTWDQEAVARERRDCERDGRALLTEFLALRESSLTLVEALREADLPRGGRHVDVGELHAGELLHEWLHHDRNHVRQIFANVQAYVWPAMGNAQRFSLS